MHAVPRWMPDDAPPAAQESGPAAAPPRVAEIELARIVSVDAHGDAMLRLERTPQHGVVRALSTGRLDAGCIGRLAAVAFIGGDPARPLILGMLRPEAVEAASIATVPAGAALTNASLAGDAAPAARTVVEARESLVFRCGEASLTLQRDGRLVLRGKDIVSYATATHRIRGAIVELN